MNLPAWFEPPADYPAALRRLPFEEMVKTARHWGRNNIYGILIEDLAPLPYVIGALQKAGTNEEAVLARKFVSSPPPPFEEKLDPKKIQAGLRFKDRKPIYGYSYALQNGAPCDRVGRSQLMFLENGKPLKPHEAHVLIRDEGLGRFSHWGAHGLLFSSSDNTDPRTNGREYKAVYPWKDSR
jgi:hypothetical protein